MALTAFIQNADIDWPEVAVIDPGIIVATWIKYKKSLKELK